MFVGPAGQILVHAVQPHLQGIAHQRPRARPRQIAQTPQSRSAARRGSRRRGGRHPGRHGLSVHASMLPAWPCLVIDRWRHLIDAGHHA